MIPTKKTLHDTFNTILETMYGEKIAYKEGEEETKEFLKRILEVIWLKIDNSYKEEYEETEGQLDYAIGKRNYWQEKVDKQEDKQEEK